MQKMLLSGIVCGLVLSAHSYAGDVPDVKTGLWSTTTTVGDSKMPQQAVSMCTSTALLQTLYDQRRKTPNQPCKQIAVTHNGAAITEQTECKFGDTVVRTRAVTVVTADTAVRTEIHQEGNSTVTVNESKYVGACPAGMQLGDFVGADGKKSNILHPDTGGKPAKSP